MRRYLLIAPAAVAAFFAARIIFAGVPNLLAILGAVAGLAATGSCVAAAARFSRGDILRTAWLTSSASFLAVTVLALQPWIGLALDPAAALIETTVVTAATNVLAVVSIWSFSRAYLVAGLDMPGAPWLRAAAVVVGTVIAAIFAGAPLVEATQRLAGHDLGAIVDVVSAAGDLMIAFLLVPMFLAALALGGGVLVWPWSFILASNAMYLCYDAQVSLFPTAWVDVWVTASAALTVAAALAQRKILAVAVERR